MPLITLPFFNSSVSAHAHDARLNRPSNKTPCFNFTMVLSPSLRLQILGCAARIVSCTHRKVRGLGHESNIVWAHHLVMIRPCSSSTKFSPPNTWRWSRPPAPAVLGGPLGLFLDGFVFLCRLLLLLR